MPLTNGNPAAEATARGAKPDVDNTPRSNKALRRAQQARETIAILAEWFPACFAVYEGRRRPLKLGIDHDITATLAAAITRQELSHALRTYCGNGGYLRASRTGTARIDLQGNPVGEVTAAEAANARQRLAGHPQCQQSPPAGPGMGSGMGTPGRCPSRPPTSAEATTAARAAAVSLPRCAA